SCRVLPSLNASYLPVMPDSSVPLLNDIWCPHVSSRSHHSGDVPVDAFCCLASATSPCPCALSALEEQSFLSQLQASDRPPEDARKGLEVPLVAVIQWSTPKLPFTSSIYTHYRLPSIRLERPCFVMTATCETPVCPRQRFTVTYTLLNELQDFLAVRLVTPKTATAGGKKLSGVERCATQPTLDAIVCHMLLNNLEFSRKGSALTIWVAFQVLCTGLLEVTNRGHCGELDQCHRCPQLSQHMKLKLQFAEAAGELVERHQAGPGQSQSFSHQHPARGRLMRSGSAAERRTITLPVRPLYLPPERMALALDKTVKRECKALVVEPIK
ncbi:LOW QUALITY PROTEIN: trafficking protein particle complex subunit 14-like, partial [Pterocles gutturalis]